MSLKTFDINRLAEIKSGQVIGREQAKLFEYALNNPRKTLHIETVGGFRTGQYVLYTNSSFIGPGEIFTKKLNARQGEKLTGVIVYDICNEFSSSEARMKVETDQLGVYSLTLTVTAPPDRELKFLIIVCSS